MRELLQKLAHELFDCDLCLICGAGTAPAYRRKKARLTKGVLDGVRPYPPVNPKTPDDLLQWLETLLCPTCRARWPFDPTPLPLLQMKPERLFHVLFPYEGAVKRALLAYKLSQHKMWAKAFAALLQVQLRRVLPADSVLVPMPTTPKRLKIRGYNPPGEILSLYANCNHYAYEDKLLLRAGEGAYQHELANREERLENMRDALVLDPAVAARYRGRLCVVFDDILTTGASLQAAADVMLAGGMRVLLLALAGPKDPVDPLFDRALATF